MRLSIIVALLMLFAGTARADVIGGTCPPGEVYETYPVPPGAMHHSGGHCVPSDPHAPVPPPVAPLPVPTAPPPAPPVAPPPPPPPPTASPTTTPPSSSFMGCSASPGPGATSVPVLLLLALVVLRRKR